MYLSRLPISIYLVYSWSCFKCFIHRIVIYQTFKVTLNNLLGTSTPYRLLFPLSRPLLLCIRGDRGADRSGVRRCLSSREASLGSASSTSCAAAAAPLPRLMDAPFLSPEACFCSSSCLSKRSSRAARLSGCCLSCRFAGPMAPSSSELCTDASPLFRRFCNRDCFDALTRLPDSLAISYLIESMPRITRSGKISSMSLACLVSVSSSNTNGRYRKMKPIDRSRMVSIVVSK